MCCADTHCQGLLVPKYPKSISNAGWPCYCVSSQLRGLRSGPHLQMVFSSSCTVYGNPMHTPIDETHPLKALSPYGRSKLIIEDMFRDVAAAEPEWRTILLRYFNPVGAHPSGNNKPPPQMNLYSPRQRPQALAATQ